MRILVALLAALVSGSPGAGTVTLEPTTFDQWQQQLSAYRPAIVVVDMWATWCDTCVKRFPKMVALDREYRDRGVRFVSMLLEDPEEPGVVELAEAFLKRQNATFDNFRMVENLMESFERLDLIGLPAVLIYDRSGALKHKLTGDDPNDQADDADVEAALIAMLDAEG